MLVFCLFALIFFTAANGEEFQKLLFSKGITRVSNQRKLDEFPNTTLPSAYSPYYYSFMVSANMGEAYVHAQQIDDDSDTPMQILIYTSQTAFNKDTSSCDVFGDDYYVCQSPYCTQNTTSPQSINYPFFSATGATTLDITNSTISIANGAWKLNASAPLYFDNCQYADDYFEDGDALGWIGLGLSAGTSNFQSSPPLFSFLINTNDDEGELIFGFNSSYTDATQTPLVVHSDPDWKIPMNSVAFGSVNSTLSTPISLVFDVQYQKIALPHDQYKSVMLELLKYQDQDQDEDKGMDCYFTSSDETSDFSDCTFVGELTDLLTTLPSLSFGLGDGTTFSLPPSSYMVKDDDTDWETIFELFDNEYANTDFAVIGSQVMANYYSVFTVNSSNVNQITLYPRPSGLFVENATTVDPNPQVDPVDNTTNTPVDNTTGNGTQPGSNTTTPGNNTTTPDNNTTTPTNATEPTNSTTTPIDTNTTNQTPEEISDADPSSTNTNVSDGSSDKSSDTALIVIMIILVIALCIVAAFFGFKGRCFGSSEPEQPTSGVELRSQSGPNNRGNQYL